MTNTAPYAAACRPLLTSGAPTTPRTPRRTRTNATPPALSRFLR